MKLFNVVVNTNASYSTEVEAETIEEAKKKAYEEWKDCDVNEIEFSNVNYDIWED